MSSSCVFIHLLLLLQVFGNADRLGDTAREYTLAGYIDSDVELNAWYDLQSTWQRLSTQFDTISRMWWLGKCSEWPGLKVLLLFHCDY
jgi:hypothetical protein